MRDTEFVKIAKALADPTRRLILRGIGAAGTLTCSCVCGMSKLSQPTISHHLGILEGAGLIKVRKRGQYHELRVNGAVLAAFAKDVVPGRRRRARERVPHRA